MATNGRSNGGAGDDRSASIGAIERPAKETTSNAFAGGSESEGEAKQGQMAYNVFPEELDASAGVRGRAESLEKVKRYVLRVAHQGGSVLEEDELAAAWGR